MHRPTQSLEQGSIVGHGPAPGFGLGMGLAQGTHRKALGRLGSPQQRAIGGPLDAAALPHLFDGVGDRGGGNDAGPGQGRCA